MALQNVTSAKAPARVSINPVHLSDGFSGRLAAPFDGVLWCVNCWCSAELVYVVYAGYPDELIAAGCATDAMISPYQKGKRLADAEGDKVRREFRKAGWLRVLRVKSVASAMQMPGITIDAIRAAKAKFVRSNPKVRSSYTLDLSAYDRPRPQLRLVVDNERV